MELITLCSPNSPGPFSDALPYAENRVSFVDNETITTKNGLSSFICAVEDWIDAVNRKLFEVKLVPVYRPELITSELAKEDAVLNKYPLLLSKVRPDDWSSWAASARLTLKPPSFIHFENSIIAFEAVLSGVGIAIGQLPLVLDDLKSGKLIVPVNRIHKGGSYVSLAARPEFIKNELFKEFRNWVRSEVWLYVEEKETFCRERQMRICYGFSLHISQADCRFG